MSTALVERNTQVAAKIEQVVIAGDLAKLTPEERVNYYKSVCESVGLNPLTRPFDYITLNSKLTLYARKDATDQLRQIHGVSVEIIAREIMDDCYVVTSKATLPNGRTDCSIGAVSLGTLKGEAKCNAMMKAETKSKRRVTLSICGMGMLDETEIESIPASRTAPVERTTEDIEIAPVKSNNAAVKGVSEPVVGPPETSERTVGGIEYINLNQQRHFHRSFKDALHENLRPHAEKLAADWLRSKGYVKDGKPSTKGIEAEKYHEVHNEAIQWARNLS